jgi:hypothetical protein
VALVLRRVVVCVPHRGQKQPLTDCLETGENKMRIPALPPEKKQMAAASSLSNKHSEPNKQKAFRTNRA